MPPPRRWFITGARRGFGRVLTEAALARGDLVVATVRRDEDRGPLVDLAPGRIWATRCDVRRPDEVGRAVDAAASVMGGIDVVVNNAGYGLFGAVEEVGDGELHEQMDVNLGGAWNVVRAALPVLRNQRRGHIVQLSSVAGLAGTPGAGAYHASKFALEGMSEALAQEVAPFGIHVLLVEPGPFRTDFAGDSARFASRTLDVYGNGARAQLHRLQQLHGHQPGDPARAAAALFRLLNAPNPPFRIVLGRDAIQRARTRTHWLAAEIDQSEGLTGDTWFPDTPPGAGLPDFVPFTHPAEPKRRRARRAPAARRVLVAIVGQKDADGPLCALAEQIGTGLVDAGYRIVTGGLGGVMAAASRGARQSRRWQDGDILGVLPGLDGTAANEAVDIVIPTGLGLARNVVLVAMADVVVAIGGGAGTLSEIALAWQYHKPIVALEHGDGWSAILAGHAVDGRRTDVVHRARDPEEVVAEVRRLNLLTNAGVAPPSAPVVR